MNFSKVKITTTVPLENAEALRQALGEAGAGQVGNYTFCSFSMRGQGRFKPDQNAHPHIGEAGKFEVVEEERVEVVCERAQAAQVVKALRQAHPYEEPIIDIVPLLNESELE